MTPYIRPGTESLEVSQSKRHATATPGPAVATREEQFTTTAPASVHPIKDSMSHTTQLHEVPQSIPTRATEASGEPAVAVEPQSTTVGVTNGSSICSDEAQKIRSINSTCPICIDLNRLYKCAESPAHELHSAAAKYESSSRGGCQGCATIARFLSGRLYTHRVGFGPLEDGDMTYRRVDNLLSMFHSSRYYHRTVKVLGYPNCPSPWPEAEVAPPISGDTGSDQAVAWARRQLEVCLSQHSACTHAKCNPLPTRVLRIDGPTDVKLYVTASDVSPYLCLSHCWGTLPIITTTSLNLEKFQQQVPWEQLSKTFQDAISFTLRLGYTYIWIDSLCIVQDSAEDWRHEGSKMASIYQNAILTLAATSSFDSTGGCFAKSSATYQSRKWNFTDSENNAFEIHTRSSLDHDEFSRWALPLSTRAWAFQERVLSPRVLHFTENELIWECSQQITCECSEVCRYMKETGETNKTAFRPNEWADESLAKIDRHWQEIVSLYTTKDLTFDKDIFPALQGLAKMVPGKMGPYLAGLWRNTVDSNLCWYVPGRLSEPRLEKWRSPSWSWASNAAQIGWTSVDWHRYSRNTDTRSTYITVLDAKVSTIGDDATGEITSGEIHIRGRGLLGKMNVDTQYMSASLDLQRADGLIMSVSTLGLHDGEGYDQGLYCSSPEMFWDYDFISTGQSHISSGTEILVMRIEKFINEEATRDRSAWLILKHSSRDLDAFERIGLSQVHNTAVMERGAYISKLEQALKSSPVMDVKIV